MEKAKERSSGIYINLNFILLLIFYISRGDE